MKDFREFDFRAITHVFTDFDGVLTDNKVYIDDTGRETVRCSRADGIGVQLLQAEDIEVIILSSEENEVVERRADKLGVTALTGLRQAHQKAEAIKRFCDPKNAVFIGNDLNDVGALRCVGFPIIVFDAHPSLLEEFSGLPLHDHQTVAKGGDGAFREVAEYILRMRRERGD